MKAYRAAILRFADDQSAVYEEDGLLVIGPGASGRQVVRAVGSYGTLAPNFPGVSIEHNIQKAIAGAHVIDGDAEPPRPHRGEGSSEITVVGDP